jgi:predicted amidohydrolase
VQLILVQPELEHGPGTHNLDTLTRLLEPHAGTLGPQDIVLLPEHVVSGSTRAPYAEGIARLAQRLGCHVVGGSHHELRDPGSVNSGLVCDARGQVVCEYEKLRPYADERKRVQGGGAFGELTIGGRRVMILICADFWFSDVFPRAQALPDLVLVPAFSVSRKPQPDYSRALWRHLAVARAYEFGVFVGISDWAYRAPPWKPGDGGRPASAVAGFADATTVDPAHFFVPLAQDWVRVFSLDFARLDSFRADRLGRGFFWKSPG